jgi:hypothetical protein
MTFSELRGNSFTVRLQLSSSSDLWCFLPHLVPDSTLDRIQLAVLDIPLKQATVKTVTVG